MAAPLRSTCQANQKDANENCQIFALQTFNRPGKNSRDERLHMTGLNHCITEDSK